MKKTLRLILGDQLNGQHSWFQKVDENIIYVLFEMRQETDYVAHHIQKVVAFFASMENFAKQLKKQSHQVVYWKLDDEKNTQSLVENLKIIIDENKIEHFEYQLPDEYRLDEQLKVFCEATKITSQVFDSEHFMSTRFELRDFFDGKKTYLMESFYRSMRRKYDLMMDGNQPVTGKWNYDKENRKKLPKDHVPIEPLVFEKDVSEVYQRIIDADVKTIGNIDVQNFIWATNREESLQVLDFFIEKCLPFFGTYQDAMTPHYWSLYHSRISFSMNVKMLSPLEVVTAAITHWEKNKDQITIAQIEGFVRQIIGWREYMRGVYWAKMPEFAELNYLEHNNKLPSYFWTGKTKMHCVRHSVQQSLDYAYAHHIQRLMVTGNFALLAGISPDELDEWYLGIYIDAIEWVEITNTRGMSQFADGGIVGTKPYVSSANYVDKMSHYCKTCFYNKKDKTGERACPFNSLYWDFYDRHRDKLEKNPRIGMAYRLWNKMDGEKRAGILKQADIYLKNLENL